MVKMFGVAWNCNGSCQIWLMTTVRDRPNNNSANLKRHATYNGYVRFVPLINYSETEAIIYMRYSHVVDIYISRN